MKNHLFLKITGAIVTLLALIPVGFATDNNDNNMFSDVIMGERHYVAIKYLAENHFINGYENNTFRPDQDINRVEALKVLDQIFNKPTLALPPTTMSPPDITFKDVKSTDWFYPLVQKAVTAKIINGYSNNTFKPADPINRAECLKIALLEEKSPLPADISKPPYSDVPAVSWYAPYAQVSKERALFLESRHNGGELLPTETLTRGEFAEFIYHLLQSKNGLTFGRATFYSDSLAGNGVAGEGVYDPTAMTAAHLTLPFGTRLLVTNLANGEQVTVTVNDRGPYPTGIKLDLSRAAFTAIAAPSTGIIYVQYQIIPDEHKF